MRKKIHLTLDKNTLSKIDFITTNLYISKGHLFDTLMEYTLKKQLKPISILSEKKKITTTVNPHIWNSFKSYADDHNLNYNSLLEESLSKQYRNYIRKIKTMKKILIVD